MKRIKLSLALIALLISLLPTLAQDGGVPQVQNLRFRNNQGGIAWNAVSPRTSDYYLLYTWSYGGHDYAVTEYLDGDSTTYDIPDWNVGARYRIKIQAEDRGSAEWVRGEWSDLLRWPEDRLPNTATPEPPTASATVAWISCEYQTLYDRQGWQSRECRRDGRLGTCSGDRVCIQKSYVSGDCSGVDMRRHCLWDGSPRFVAYTPVPTRRTAPYNIRGSASADGIVIGWDYQGRPNDFVIYRRRPDAGETGLGEIGTVPGNQLRFVDTRARSWGERYIYRIRARHGDGDDPISGPFSVRQVRATATDTPTATATATPVTPSASPTPVTPSATPTLIPLLAPGNFRATSVSSVAWNAVTGAVSYGLNWKPAINGREHDTTSGRSYTLAGMTPGVRYSIRVNAIGGFAGYESYSGFTGYVELYIEPTATPTPTATLTPRPRDTDPPPRDTDPPPRDTDTPPRNTQPPPPCKESCSASSGTWKVYRTRAEGPDGCIAVREERTLQQYTCSWNRSSCGSSRTYNKVVSDWSEISRESVC